MVSCVKSFLPLVSSGGLRPHPLIWLQSVPGSPGALVRLSPASAPGSLGWVTESCDNTGAFVTLFQSAKQSSSEPGGMRDGCRLRHWVVPRMMTKLGFVWILIYLACPGSGPSVRGCQCTVASQAALATHCLPHWQCQEGWVPAAAWQMWKLVPLKPNIAIETSKRFFVPLYFDTRDHLFII